jgi:hypothetical protein
LKVNEAKKKKKKGNPKKVEQMGDVKIKER